MFCPDECCYVPFQFPFPLPAPVPPAPVNPAEGYTFANGITPLALTAAGPVAVNAAIADGSALLGVTVAGGVISGAEIIGGTLVQGFARNLAFPGRIGALRFTVTQLAALAALATPGTVTVTLYAAPAGSTTFTAIPGQVATATFPAAVVAIGDTAASTVTPLTTTVYPAGTQVLAVATVAGGLIVLGVIVAIDGSFTTQ